MISDLNPKKIIVRMPNWLGDFIMATPCLSELRKKFPSAEITAMCLNPLGELLLYDPNVDKIFSFKKNHLIQALRTGSYDLGVLLTNSFSSAWIFYHGKVKHRLGYKTDFRSFFLSTKIPFSKERERQHLVLTYQELLRPLGIIPSAEGPKMHVSEDEVKKAYEFLKRYKVEKQHTIIGINPGAAYGSAKCWLPERFQEVALQMLACYPDSKILFFGDNHTKLLVDQICGDLNPSMINLAGKTTLRQLAALIKICKVFLTNDSGPMHMADALGVPLLALFGSTSPVMTGPFHKNTILKKEVSCSPCYKRVCPIDFRCMKQIHSDEVFSYLKTLVDKQSHV